MPCAMFHEHTIYFSRAAKKSKWYERGADVSVSGIQSAEGREVQEIFQIPGCESL